MVGLLASPSLWRPQRIREATRDLYIGGPVEGVVFTSFDAGAEAPWAVVDDGDSAVRALCTPSVLEQMRMAVPDLDAGQMIGLRWNVWLVNAAPDLVRLDACVPAHPMQMVARLMTELTN